MIKKTCKLLQLGAYRVVAAIILELQMLLTAVKLAPALAMGNTVVIKASELAPVTLLEFAKIIEKTEYLKEL